MAADAGALRDKTLVDGVRLLTADLREDGISGLSTERLGGLATHPQVHALDRDRIPRR